jgi:dienelactone hydrolase
MTRVFRFLFAAGLAVALLSAGHALAHVLIFKDGFALSGRIRAPGSFVADPVTGTAVFITQGVYILDADARLILFSHHHVPPEGVLDKDLEPENELIRLENRPSSKGPPMYPILNVSGATDWNADWERTIKMRVNFGKQIGRLDTEQRVAVLTPRYARLDARKYAWSSFYTTDELGPAAVRSLLFTYPSAKTKDLKDDPDWRFRVYQFFVQAGWFDVAEAELAGIEKDLPGEKEKVEAARPTLVKLRAIQGFEEIEKARQAGRHRWAQEQLAKLPRAGMDDKLLASVRTLRSEYEAAAERVALAHRYLQELPPQVAPAVRPLLVEATGAVRDDLDGENVTRLEAFLAQAQQAERAAAAGAPPAKDPAALLALAVSGWLLGKDLAEDKVETAQRLWKARQFVLKYQNTADVGLRERMLKEYQQTGTDVLGVDEMAQLIRFLPPPRPEPNLGTEPVPLKTDLPTSRKRGINYVVQLPPEYHHSRPYPVLVVLHAGGSDGARAMLDRVAGFAARHGYIAAAPDWEVWGNAYEYTAEEQEAVTDVLADLRRRFQVDSDRVFLFGAGEGGKMAFDVGLAHPDLFAGVAPMAAGPQKHAERYWPNAQHLPFYVVDGTFSGPIAEQNQKLFKKWVPLGFPAIYVQYKGRGIEWLGGELPTLFDWMDRKQGEFKRATAVPELGKAGGSLNQEFQSLRSADTRFYWLSSDGLRPGQTIDGRKWDARVVGASLHGRIQENTVHVFARNFKQITVWLSRDMIDYSKPVTVRINSATRMNGQRVQPSLATLLEDFYQRGDRQRLYWAKLDFDRL